MVFTFGQFQVRIERLPAVAAPSAGAAFGRGLGSALRPVASRPTASRGDDARRAEEALAWAKAEQLLEQQRHAVQRWQSLHGFRHF